MSPARPGSPGSACSMRRRRRASARYATSSIWPARPSRSWRGGSRSCASRRRSGFTTFIDTAQISALERKLDELRRARDQTQARIAFLEGPPDTRLTSSNSAPAPDDTAGVKDRAKRLERIQRGARGHALQHHPRGQRADHRRARATDRRDRCVAGQGWQQRRAGRPADRAVGGGAGGAALAAACQGDRGRREGACRQRAGRGGSGRRACGPARRRSASGSSPRR